MWLCDTSVKVFSKMSLKPLSSEIVSVWVLFYDVTVTKEMRSGNGALSIVMSRLPRSMV